MGEVDGNEWQEAGAASARDANGKCGRCQVVGQVRALCCVRGCVCGGQSVVRVCVRARVYV